MPKKRTLPSKTTKLTRTKARKILKDKKVRGKLLVDKQRKFMGVVANRENKPRKKKK